YPAQQREARAVAQRVAEPPHVIAETLEGKRRRCDLGEVATREGEEVPQRPLDFRELRLREDVEAVFTVIDLRAFPARARTAQWRHRSHVHLLAGSGDA